MRLLHTSQNGDAFNLVEYVGIDIPPYAILSHTWGPDAHEVNFQDFVSGDLTKQGYNKLVFCGKQALKDGLQYFWIDTCCIDKSSSSELAEALNSMFRWYRNAQRCYVYLTDVSNCSDDNDVQTLQRWRPAFKSSRWFRRGWTLQELIAPSEVEFFSKEGTYLGNKRTLEHTIHEITGIPMDALRGVSLTRFSIQEKMSWTKNRETKREEDMAYCLLGLFGVVLSPIYGEGRARALERLSRKANKLEMNHQLSNLGPSLSTSQRTEKMEERRMALIKSLSFNHIQNRQMAIETASFQTCQWLLTKKEYLEWLSPIQENKHAKILWIKGKPGAGKSTLMKFAFLHAVQERKQRITLSFFFNARGQELEKSTTGMFQSLLLQLLKCIPSIPLNSDLDLISSEKDPSSSWELGPLKSHFQQVLQYVGGQPVICFVDALDECDEDQIRDMIKYFERLIENSTSSGTIFRVCLASRHYPNISIKWGTEIVLEHQQGHNQDIAQYLANELRIGSNHSARLIRAEIYRRASGVFMWVVLVTRILNKAYDRGLVHSLETRLKELPDDLHDLFRSVLLRNNHEQDKLRICLQCVLFAKRPLSPLELHHAIIAGDPNTDISIELVNDTNSDVTRKFILDASKGFVEVTGGSNPGTQFIHESVREYLLGKEGLSRLWPDQGANFIGHGHNQLKQCCSTYLSWFASQLLYQTNVQHNDTWPFLEYATRNMLFHADTAQGTGYDQEEWLSTSWLKDWISAYNILAAGMAHVYTGNVSSLYIFAEQNLINLLERHRSKHKCLQLEEQRYGCAMFAAIAGGHETASLLLEKAFGTHYGLPGFVYELKDIWSESERPRGLLFSRSFQFYTSRGILFHIIQLGHRSIASTLLKPRWLPLSAPRTRGRDALCWAIWYERYEIVTDLLASPISGQFDEQIEDDLVPFWIALIRRDKRQLDALIAANPSEIERVRKGLTPLGWAIQEGDHTMVKILLKAGADVNRPSYLSLSGHQDKYSWIRPFFHAKSTQHTAITNTLLATGKVRRNWASPDGCIAIWSMVSNNRTRRVEAVFKGELQGFNQTDARGMSVLAYIAWRGLENVLEILLRIGGIDVNIRGLHGLTPIMWATQYGNLGIIKNLLGTKKVDLGIKEHIYGRTVLFMAVFQSPSHGDRIVKMLLDNHHDFDIDDVDRYGKGLLEYANHLNQQSVVALLEGYRNEHQRRTSCPDAMSLGE